MVDGVYGSHSVEMLFAHLKRILKLDRLRLRGMKGATDKLTMAATMQNQRRLAKFTSQGPPATGYAPAPSKKPQTNPITEQQRSTKGRKTLNVVSRFSGGSRA